MADTQELVLWSLEQACPLRASPAGRGEALERAAWIQQTPEHLVSGFYLSSLTCISHELSLQDFPLYPSCGFSTDEVFSAVGGLDGLRVLCGSCPANTYTDGLAGCHGSIYQRPDSDSTEEQLRAIIARKDLGPAVEANFPDFRPLWRAFWTTSPLPASSIPVLRLLLGEMLAEDRLVPQAPYCHHLRDLSRFLDALDVAESQGLSLHVELLPLGHTEDTYTIFPHCPFCKSLARGQGLFRRRYRDVPQICDICGTEFSPAKTASDKRILYKPDCLRTKLGNERFRQLALEYLIQVGETHETAGLMVESQELRHLELTQSMLAESEKYRLEIKFLAEHVYIGLTNLEPPSDGCDGHPVSKPWDDTWLNATDIAVALHRAQEHGFICTMLVHRGEWDEMDRHHYERPFDPHGVLELWRNEGCNEKFHAVLEKPKVLSRDELATEMEATMGEFMARIWGTDQND